MHVRFTTCVGASVLEEGSHEPIGVITGMLPNPDTGTIHGFFVRTRGVFSSHELFLAVADIAHWGVNVHVRHVDHLAPLEDFQRLVLLTQEGRTLLRQKIVTETGASLGRCADVQFDTQHFSLEWLFPRQYFRWRRPIPVSAIIEVRRDAIVVRDAAKHVPLTETVLDTLVPLAEAPTVPQPQTMMK